MQHFFACLDFLTTATYGSLSTDADAYGKIRFIGFKTKAGLRPSRRGGIELDSYIDVFTIALKMWAGQYMRTNLIGPIFEPVNENAIREAALLAPMIKDFGDQTEQITKTIEVGCYLHDTLLLQDHVRRGDSEFGMISPKVLKALCSGYPITEHIFDVPDFVGRYRVTISEGIWVTDLTPDASVITERGANVTMNFEESSNWNAILDEKNPGLQPRRWAHTGDGISIVVDAVHFTGIVYLECEGYMNLDPGLPLKDEKFEVFATTDIIRRLAVKDRKIVRLLSEFFEQCGAGITNQLDPISLLHEFQKLLSFRMSAEGRKQIVKLFEVVSYLGRNL
jgi:hypothetical protein